MQAQDVMTSPVITVRSDAKIEEVAQLLLDKGISGVPVIDGRGWLAGILSEADLLHRPEIGAGSKGRWWLELFTDQASLASRFARIHGTRARDVMTPGVVEVPPDTELLDVLAEMERHGVRRVLVIEREELVGIVTRSDILRGVLAVRRHAGAVPSDRAIRAALMDRLAGEMWVTLPASSITVTNGVVSLWGEVASPEEREALRVAAESIPGVSAVDDHLRLRGAAAKA